MVAALVVAMVAAWYGVVNERTMTLEAHAVEGNCLGGEKRGDAPCFYEMNLGMRPHVTGLQAFTFGGRSIPVFRNQKVPPRVMSSYPA